MRRGVWRGFVAGGVLAAAIAMTACSDDAAPDSTPVVTTIGPAITLPADTTDLPLVEQIPVAIVALEEQLGGPQDYFEINATARLVNLFVALNDGTVAQAWVYLDGELTSTEGQSATGNTFRADDLTFDANGLLTEVAAQLPDSALEVVEIVGGEAGDVRYTVVATSPQGGQLLIVVGPDGAVLSVDAA